MKKIFITILFSLLTPTLALAFDPVATFDKKCSSCHTVGAGDDVGPDLKDIVTKRPKDWLIRWIQSSQDMIAAGDPVGVELFAKFKNKKMPDQELSVEEVGQLLDFITAGGPKEAPIQDKPASKATPVDITRGEHLFLGRVALTNGAPSCISCHSVADYGPLGGGSLGLDLTQVYSKYEDKGLSKSLRKPGFPIMKELFAEKPLTDDEAFALKAFLYQADQAGYRGGGYGKKFLFLGMGGTAVMLGVGDFVWRKRRRKSSKPWNRK